MGRTRKKKKTVKLLNGGIEVDSNLARRLLYEKQMMESRLCRSCSDYDVGI